MPSKKTRKHVQPLKQRRLLNKKLYGGSINKLPVPSDFATFNEHWNTFYVGAHGTIGNDMIVVPPNTYILNMSTAGFPCGVIKHELENLIYDYENGEGREGGNGSTSSRESIMEKLWKLLLTGKFLDESSKESIYINENVGQNITQRRKSYLYNTSEFNIKDPFKNSGRPSKSSKSIAFYEPGDLMYDTFLKLYNNTTPFFLVGMYKIPISYSYKKQIFDENRAHNVFPPHAKIHTVTNNNVKSQLLISKPIMADFDNVHIKLFNKPENIMQEKMFRSNNTIKQKDFRLHDIFAMLDPDKTNFIIVDSCRSLINPLHSAPQLNLKRRMSILTRKLIPFDSKQFFTLNIDSLIDLKHQLEAIKNPSLKNDDLDYILELINTIITSGKTRDNDLKMIFEIISEKNYIKLNAEFVDFLSLP